jgi:hypothetical protein
MISFEIMRKKPTDCEEPDGFRVRWLSPPIADGRPEIESLIMTSTPHTSLSDFGSFRQPIFRGGREVTYGLPKDNDRIIIFRRWFRHWRTGKIVYPKNGKVIVIRLQNKQPKLPFN